MLEFRSNTYSVMAQRSEPKTSNDDFPTPPWATRALMEHVLSDEDTQRQTCLEPACGRGYMSETLKEYFERVIASDIEDYGYGKVDDFLNQKDFQNIDWVITNPPFKHAEAFINRGLSCANIGVAVLVRTVFIESIGRYMRLFSKNPPNTLAQFSERVPIVRGKIDPKASSATGYAWLIWQKKQKASAKVVWIPPCRSNLEFEYDYSR